MDVNMATQQNKAASAFDERRGAHLMRPGDLVRYNGDVWDVTGIFLATERWRDMVGMEHRRDGCRTELKIPLSLVEGACEIYLRADVRRSS